MLIFRIGARVSAKVVIWPLAERE